MYEMPQYMYTARTCAAYLVNLNTTAPYIDPTNCTYATVNIPVNVHTYTYNINSEIEGQRVVAVKTVPSHTLYTQIHKLCVYRYIHVNKQMYIYIGQMGTISIRQITGIFCAISCIYILIKNFL